MRPQNLYQIFSPVTTLSGIGSRLELLIKRIAGPNVIDLLWHFPYALKNRYFVSNISRSLIGKTVIVKLQINQHLPSKSSKSPYQVICSSKTQNLTLGFFRANENWIKKILPIGRERIVSGKIEMFNNSLQIIHPEYIVLPDHEILTIEAIYPLTTGLSGKVIQKAINSAIELITPLPEWIDSDYLHDQNWLAWHDALRLVHKPTNEKDLSSMSLARQRLAYDELLANQLALTLNQANLHKQANLRKEIRNVPTTLRKKIIKALPFRLTKAQIRVLNEIDTDLSSSSYMFRLLHGDVGSGKTIIALLAMVHAVEKGSQATLMAPTEILARQHLKTIENLTSTLDLKIALLTRHIIGNARKKILKSLSCGDIDILIGTHALLSDDVIFQNLTLAVIDEQHRFGVHQRLNLVAKGLNEIDILVMTATPIPRTMMLAIYGDMDISHLDEKPPGRKSIDTRVLPMTRLDKVIGSLMRIIKEGAKVYWICPLIEDSKKSDAAALSRHHELIKYFGSRVGLIHGKMSANEKEIAMSDFSGDKLDLLVATTVIEVGINVLTATVMVIEHAQRFGLAQLHQLRGRIGRSNKNSTCLLLYEEPLSESARTRLNILRDSEDGFYIAEQDMKLRGFGELLGTKQSGMPEFRLADLTKHTELLTEAHNHAKEILKIDPKLQQPRGQAIRILLYLFEHDDAIKNLDTIYN
ncbi:MAG: ATP-dependent DNA helicase RecG [Rhodospirillaceae bacterium]|jgi:ATP-dependent DNA helicase RecG|nr:ATP-dependent DNA helicase RecG [Rhodospirillaceae bacterium]